MHEYVQNYRIDADTFVLDPRFLLVRGGVGYQITNENPGGKFDSLSYDITTSFFQGMRYSFELNAAHNTTTVSPVGLPEYDVTMSTYGAVVSLNFGSAGRNGNNNNNNSNNNNNNGNNFRNRGSFRIPLPDIRLEQTHTESESTSLVSPLLESRDTTRAYVFYKLASNLKLDLDGTLEKYRNDLLDQGYDSKAVDMHATWLVTAKSDLNVTGRTFKRETDNIRGFDINEKSDNLSLVYHVNEINRLEQFYNYNYTKQENTLARSESQIGGGRISYRMNKDLTMFGRLDYGQDDYVQFPTLAFPAEQKYSLKAGTAGVGAAYSRVYAPSFLQAFLFHTDYDFFAGFKSVSEATQVAAGGGILYGNNLGIGLLSNGWQSETAQLDYRFSNQRDNSPAANDKLEHVVTASVSTSRVPKTNFSLNASYTASEISSALQNYFTAQVANSMQKRHELLYNATATYTPTDYLLFDGGATRSRSTLDSQTLSNLGPSQNVQSDDTYLYGRGLLHYFFTRQVEYNLQLRADHRISNYAATIRSDTDEIRTWINYRIRMVYLSLEYRLREATMGSSPKTTEQYIYTKLSRPF